MYPPTPRRPGSRERPAAGQWLLVLPGVVLLIVGLALALLQAVAD